MFVECSAQQIMILFIDFLKKNRVTNRERQTKQKHFFIDLARNGTIFGNFWARNSDKFSLDSSVETVGGLARERSREVDLSNVEDLQIYFFYFRSKLPIIEPCRHEYLSFFNVKHTRFH